MVYGGHRPGDNLFSDSLVALDAATGERVWHFQMVHHDVWEYDTVGPPILGDITVDGRRIEAVMQPSKTAFLYVFDRATGEPVWPIEERPVPASTVPGEWTAPTQPFPTRPPAFDLQGATEENLIDFTPQLRQRALEQLQQFDHGPLFTPPSLRGTLILPGIVGGANWPGGAFDRETGLFYVASRMNPSLVRVSPVDPARSNLQYRGQAGGPGQGGVGGMPDAASRMTVDGLPLFKPPYFRVTALDMSTGEQRWMAPLGNGPLNHPLLRDLDLAPLGGDYHRGSVLVTKSLLFVSMSAMHSQGVPQRAAWSEWADPDDELNLLYAFDKLSGELLNTLQLAGFSAAAPMTYEHEGRQYVVVATGSGPDSAVVALGLPDQE
jgi:quinoprotein glucose dehydrogenase